ncbi:MAG: hypothetical protein ACJ0GE_04180 [Candidatus Actinomarina sp.]
MVFSLEYFLASQGGCIFGNRINEIGGYTLSIRGLQHLIFTDCINNFLEDGYALDNQADRFRIFQFYILHCWELRAVYLNKDSPQLTYYKTAVYPVYIVHLPVQMAVMYFFAGIKHSSNN